MGKEDITTIPYVRKCFYDTYANLPVAGIRIGDLGFATDRLVLYRWSGAAWQAITIHFSSGIAANIPTAADLPDGSCYYTTDTKLLRQVQAGAWVTIVQAPDILTEYLLFPVLTEEAGGTVLTLIPGHYAHGINPVTACVITRIAILVAAITGTGGNIIVEIWDDSGGDANAVIANGSITKAKGDVVLETWNWFVFATPPALAANTLYHVVVRSSDAEAANRFSFYTWDGKPTYANGFWGVGTKSRKQPNGAPSDELAVIDMIYGRKA